LETMKTRAQFHELPYHEKYESKHVFFADHDNALPFGSKAIWFRASLLRSKRDPQTVSFPYGCDLNLGRTMEDLIDIHESDADRIYDTSFVGCVGNDWLRHKVLKSVADSRGLRAYITSRKRFWGRHQIEGTRSEFLKSITESLTVLCPKGAGTNSIRFFETMSAGRVPVLISDQVVLPFEDIIDYSQFTIRIPEKMAENTGIALERRFDRLGRKKLIEMGKLARKAYAEELAIAHYPRQIHRNIRKFIPA